MCLRFNSLSPPVACVARSVFSEMSRNGDRLVGVSGLAGPR
ncbi:hypothetical protein HMPREF9620_02205 [Cutibacterium acnes HL037PA1]|nr:hypothetical protein PAZ_c11140 [Cutibacterium acnes 266]EFS43180.1 hypothetical protein HMPREF9576_01738 [Cutibacterium acnes HL110PA2]EFS50617.1 hypothetical protein HMPREF9587_01715 [Cutibacterium acnes HL025PA1]EFT06859.1 hypothetical protein HMPREF9618_02088 [Cutibacterium acnes HL082PA1]EFT11972.1 hypothetical protein HMPREF9620_02205 [Cutibacterium acnes HL037PA1]EGE89755.1 hypothetical protein HMPREF9568_02220 [Cutibacterium acnes HL013PA2]EGE92537.1 hypothetical protein HMPREF9571